MSRYAKFQNLKLRGKSATINILSQNRVIVRSPITVDKEALYWMHEALGSRTTSRGDFKPKGLQAAVTSRRKFKKTVYAKFNSENYCKY